jgi:formyltetrahydrofolate synthetase
MMKVDRIIIIWLFMIGSATSPPVPITADDLGCAGAMLVLMKDAIQPTLMQVINAGA